MQPPRFKHARSLHVLAAILLLVGGAGPLSGCTSAPTPPSLTPTDTLRSSVGRDSVLAVLTSMRRAAFDSSFAVLDTYTVRRTVRTERLDSTGTPIATRSHVLRYPPAPATGTLLDTDSSGTFRDGGLLGHVAPDRAPTDRPPNVAAQILPDQPAYVEPRTREAYRYALQARTRPDGVPVYVIEAQARDRGTGRDQSVRYARLTLDRDARQLIGLTTVRADDGLLFSEFSRFELHLQPLADGAWGPARTHARAFLHVPFRAPRHFRTVSTFSNYTR